MKPLTPRNTMSEHFKDRLLASVLALLLLLVFGIGWL